MKVVPLSKERVFPDPRELWLKDVVRILLSVISAKDPITASHSIRVCSYAIFLGKKIHLSSPELRDLKLASLLHDIGKLGIPDEILMKPGPLTKQEFEIMKRHPIHSANILSQIADFREIIPIVRAHQERIDGGGYPDGLKGKKIPLLSRIISIVDAYDAMISDRPYRKALPPEKAIQELTIYAGTQFDLSLVKVFLNSYKDIEMIQPDSDFSQRDCDPSSEMKKAIGE